VTSREAYNKIRWDDRFDASRVKVGYQDRFQGVLEIGFNDQKLSRDVPWHRIVHFRYDSQIIWDRQGTDIFDSLHRSPVRENHFCFGWNDSEWTSPDTLSEKLTDRPLTLVSWNVLFDLCDDGVPTTESRFPSLLQELRHQNADLVALQEVTPRLCRLLADEPWIQEQYFLSQQPHGPQLQPYGPLLLSRCRGRFEHLELSAGKTVVKGCLEFESGPVQIFVVHLFSDRTEQAPERREKQLFEVLSHARQEAGIWLVGDMNTRGVLAVPGLRDAWLDVGCENGLTFDPAINRLARLTSRRARSGRLDRLYTRGGWHCQRIEVAQDSGNISDHHLLRCHMSPPIGAKPVHRSALAIVVPPECSEPIQSIRKRCDKGYDRWMPHINLLYGFLPEQIFQQAKSRLQARLGRRRPFKIRLREFHRFTHKKSVTIWLKPETDPPSLLQQLQSDCESLFETCTEQSGRGDQGFTPHLTVAQGPPFPALKPVDLEFEVQEIHLLSRRESEPFETRETMRFEGEALVAPTLSEIGIQEAFDKLRSCLPGQLFKVGSSALELGLPWSDLDCLYLGYEPVQEVQKRLPQARLVPVRVVLFCFELSQVQVDLQYARFPDSLSLRPPEEMSKEELELLSPESRMAVHARLEIDALTRLVDAAQFRPFLRTVREWTHHRCLDDPALGFPGGLAWSLLAARSFQKDRDLESGWEMFLAEVGGWPGDPFPVMSLTEPFVDTAPQVTPLTREIVLREVRRAEELVHGKSWSKLFEPLTIRQEKIVSFPLNPRCHPEECLGWLKGQMVTFLLQAESEQVFFRPIFLTLDGNQVRLGLDCPHGEPEGAVEGLRKAYAKWCR
jgi:poly(A) polymerase